MFSTERRQKWKQRLIKEIKEPAESYTSVHTISATNSTTHASNTARSGAASSQTRLSKSSASSFVTIFVTNSLSTA